MATIGSHALHPTRRSRHILIAIALATMLASIASASGASRHPPSFDCAAAKTRTERAICADPVSSRVDAAIARRYRELLRALDPATAKALQADQRGFGMTRDALLDARAPAANPIADLVAMQRDRLSFLDAIDATPAPGVVGHWRNATGETTVERAKNGGLRVSINAAEPSEGRWVCEFAGSASEAPDADRLVVEPDDGNGPPLTLRRVGAGLSVDGSPTGDAIGGTEYCGLNGSVDGIYFARTGKR